MFILQSMKYKIFLGTNPKWALIFFLFYSDMSLFQLLSFYQSDFLFIF